MVWPDQVPARLNSCTLYQGWPMALMGRDLIGLAETGSGEAHLSCQGPETGAWNKGATFGTSPASIAVH